MKRGCRFTVLLAGLLLISVLSGSAFAADIVPLNPDPETDLNNGTFCIGLRDLDKIEEEGFFTADLYVEERYDAEQIKALAPGDTVRMNGSVWTVEKMVIHEDQEGGPEARELYPVEEFWGYIAFWPQEDGTYLGVMNDWCPVIPVGEAKITLPLPDRFAFYTYSAGEKTPPEDFQAMLDYLETFGNDFTPYNTTGVFEEGALTEIVHSSYPEGPEEYGDE